MERLYCITKTEFGKTVYLGKEKGSGQKQWKRGADSAGVGHFFKGDADGWLESYRTGHAKSIYPTAVFRVVASPHSW